MKKNLKKLALKKIFLLFIIISSCFLIGDVVSKKIKPTSTITIKNKITIENTFIDSVLLDIIVHQEITKSLKFRELEFVMEETRPRIYVGNLITDDLMDNKKKISIISDEIERIRQQIHQKILVYIDHYINTTSAGPDSQFLSSIQKDNERLTNLGKLKYVIANDLEFILVKYEEDIKLMNKYSKIFKYIYYLILSIIISVFISYISTSRQLKCMK